MTKQMYNAGEYSGVLLATAEMFQLCRGEGAEPQLLCDAHLLTAKAYWRLGRILASFLALGQAVAIRPRIMTRPLKPFSRLIPG